MAEILDVQSVRGSSVPPSRGHLLPEAPPSLPVPAGSSAYQREGADDSAGIEFIVIVTESDAGLGLAPGRYLFGIDADGAYLKGDDNGVFGPPFPATVVGPSDPRIAEFTDSIGRGVKA